MLSSLYSSIFESNATQNETPSREEEVSQHSTSQEQLLNNTLQRKTTQVDSTSLSIQSPEYSSISTLSSPNVSPIKNNRSNGMLESSSSFTESHNTYSNFDNIDFTNSDTQKSLFIYLLEKNRQLENLFVNSAKENEKLREENVHLAEKIENFVVNSSKEYDDLHEENVQLAEKIEKLRRENVQMTEQIGALATPHSPKCPSCETLTQKIENLESSQEFDSSQVKRQLQMIHRNMALQTDLIISFEDKIRLLTDELKEVKENNEKASVPASEVSAAVEVSHSDAQSEVSCNEDIKQIQYELGRLRIDFETEKNESKTEFEKIDDEIYELEKKTIKSSQYTRRNNLIIEGIPDNVPQNELEAVCIDIIRKIGFPVTPYEVEGCHRLFNKDSTASRPTIIRFTNRKIKEFCVQKRWRLPKIGYRWKLVMREDLEFENQAIHELCEDLKKKKFIEKFVVSNGFIKVCETKGSKPVKIDHPSDLHTMFSEFFNIYPDYRNA